MYLLNEAIEKGVHKPIFIILTEGKTPLISSGIRFFTKSNFTHCSISFDPLMREIYSYNFGKKNSGFIKENLFGLGRGRKISIFTFFVDPPTYAKVRKNFNMYKRNKDKTQYSFSRLFLKIINRGAERDPYKQVCSSFVHSVLFHAGINIAPEDIKLVSPADIDATITKNNTVYLTYEGHALDFDPNSFLEKLDKLYADDQINPYKNLNEGFISDTFNKLKEKSKEDKLFIKYKRYLEANKNKEYLLTFEEFKEYQKLKKQATDDIKDKVKKEILTESINPDLVDKSNFYNFKLFDLFNIYTTDESLQYNEKFIKKMRWVKDNLETIANESRMKLEMYDLTLCSSFEELDEFYGHEAPKWVTGFTWGNQVYMKAPNIYNGELYYNIVLHEALHVLLFNNIKRKGISIPRNKEEGFAVFFSTPLNLWLKELNHNGANWYYYENAIDIQDIYINKGMYAVLKHLIS